MKHVVTLSAIVAAVALAPAASAEPAWGGNCLSCHSQLVPDSLTFIGQAGLIDPDESGTGAPDRGLRPYFKAYRGETTALQVGVADFSDGDKYALQLKRLRFPGVELGGTLRYTGDCEWAEWGDHANYFSDPIIAHTWGTGPTTITFNIDVAPDADNDIYDVVFAVAGRFEPSGVLFESSEHFYLQISHAPGDMNCDGTRNGFDIDPFVLALTDPDGYAAAFPGCDRLLADVNCDGSVDGFDIDTFVQCLTGECPPCS